MGWVLIVGTLVVLWVASLCKILRGSSSPSRSLFLNTAGALPKRNILLVVAHPDDESMRCRWQGEHQKRRAPSSLCNSQGSTSTSEDSGPSRFAGSTPITFWNNLYSFILFEILFEAAPIIRHVVNFRMVLAGFGTILYWLRVLKRKL